MRQTESVTAGKSGRATGRKSGTWAVRKFERTATALVLLLLVAPLARTGAQEAKRRGVTPEDYFAFEFAGDPRVSPDGSLIAYVLTTVDQRQNRRQSQIWIASTDGSLAPRQFTTSTQSSNSPRWSPDGRSLAFLSARPSSSEGNTSTQTTSQATPTPTPASTPLPAQTVPQATETPAPASTPGAIGTATTPGVPSALQTAAAAGEPQPRNQVWVLSLDGGEARRVTNLKNGVGTFDWSPDGKRMALTSRTGPSDRRAPSSDVRHYKHLSYKFNDTGWFDDKRSHIWVVDVADGYASQITSGEAWNDPDPQWSPDSSRIAFVSDRTRHAFDESRNTDVFVIPFSGGPIRKISDHDEEDNSPRWSPDGKLIAFIGRIHERDHPKIVVAPAGGGASRNVSPELDLIPSNLRWAEQGRALYFETGVRGETHLFRVEAKDGKLTQVTRGPRSVRLVDINERTRRIAYAAIDFRHLDDLYVASLDGSNERKLSSLNEKLWSQLQLADVERMTYKGADGWDVDGFMVKPVGWQEGKKYPLILSVHGGPAGQYGVDWFHEFQVYAARGWAVFYCNPRGSTGYGQKFERGIEGEWGGKDYTDIMNGVEAALQKYPWVVRARQHFGVPSEFVIFPRENHNLTRTGEPKHLVESLNWQLYWFDRYLNGNESAIPPDTK